MINKVFLALLSALLLILAFTLNGFSVLAWVALVPVLLTTEKSKPIASFILFFIFGIVFLMGHFSWINTIKGVRISDFLLMGLYLGSYFAFFGAWLNVASRVKCIPLVLSGPAIWVSLEFLRSHAGFLALPWALLGHSQHSNLSIIQISSWTGVYGVSFLIVMVNIGLCSAIHKKKGTGRVLGAVFALMLAVIAYGKVELTAAPSNNEIPVTIIQGNIAQNIKWKKKYKKQNLEKHLLLTRKASSKKEARLIVWPETAVPGSFRHDIYLTRELSSLARDTGAYIILGGAQRPKAGSKKKDYDDWHNSSYLISPKGGIIGQYNKIRLLPFAEYTPYQDILPWPSHYSTKNRYSAGEEYTLFAIDDILFGTAICWENIFSEIIRQFVKNGAMFMVNITNEAWFGETRALSQFLTMSIFRAVENRITVIRAANTGISCFIDPHGRVFGKVEKNGKDIAVEGYLTQDVPFIDQKTIYTKFGDVFSYINIVISAAVLLIFLLKSVCIERRFEAVK